LVRGVAVGETQLLFFFSLFLSFYFPSSISNPPMVQMERGMQMVRRYAVVVFSLFPPLFPFPFAFFFFFQTVCENMNWGFVASDSENQVFLFFSLFPFFRSFPPRAGSLSEDDGIRMVGIFPFPFPFSFFFPPFAPSLFLLKKLSEEILALPQSFQRSRGPLLFLFFSFFFSILPFLRFFCRMPGLEQAAEE